MNIKKSRKFVSFEKRLMRMEWATMSQEDILETETVINEELEEKYDNGKISKGEYIAMMNELVDYVELWLDVRKNNVAINNTGGQHWKWGGC